VEPFVTVLQVVGPAGAAVVTVLIVVRPLVAKLVSLVGDDTLGRELVASLTRLDAHVEAMPDRLGSAVRDSLPCRGVGPSARACGGLEEEGGTTAQQ